MSKKSTKALASATVMSLVLTTALSAMPVKAAAGQVTRTSGSDRYQTAAQVATTNWKDGAKEVVLVSGEGYADAVSASVLAKTINAPILLSTAGNLSIDAKDALEKLKPEKVYVIGGNASISQSVRSDLKAKYTLVELNGQNRYETNVAVANELIKNHGVKADNVMVVGGEGFSDALSVAPVAATKGQILLLGSNDDDSMKSIIKFVADNKSKVTVVGTKNIINEDMYKALNAEKRIDGGSDRFDTNLKVLEAFKADLKADKLYVANATGDGYADALVASALAGKSAAPLVLVDTETSSATSKAIDYIGSTATKATDLNVVGGTGVVSDATVKQIDEKVSPHKDTDQSVESVECVSLNQIKVHFGSAIDSDSAEAVENYKIDGTQLVPVGDDRVATSENSAVAKAIDSKTVLITLAQGRTQGDKVSVTVKNGGVLTEDKEGVIKEYKNDIVFSDSKAPSLEKVTVEGNRQITLEFSEAVNMKTVNELKDKVKIDDKTLSNYGINTTQSKIKNSLKIVDKGNLSKGEWGFKVLFYLDSTIDEGNHTLKVSDGIKDGILSDYTGYTVKDQSKTFDVKKMSTIPEVKSVKETKSGEISITFDRSMDVDTAERLSNYEINNTPLTDIAGATFDDDNDHTVIKIQHVGKAIKAGANTLYVKDTVKDAWGLKIKEDCRVNFEQVKDETKPIVKSAEMIDGETIKVRFSKDVKHSNAVNLSNYTLEDNKGIDISNHIDKVVSSSGETNTDDTDTYNIKMKKWSNDGKEDWRLTGSKYNLTIDNIVDTASPANKMEKVVKPITGKDDIKPKGVGIYYKAPKVEGDKDKVIVTFSEAMDTSTLQNKKNYKFIDGKGDTQDNLPSDTNITPSADNKSAIIELPSNYHAKVDAAGMRNGSETDVTGIIVTGVKDEAGNDLDEGAFNFNKTITVSKDGAKVKEKTLKVSYEDNTGDDLEVRVQFDKAIDDKIKTDFKFGGVTPSTIRVESGDVLVLKFEDKDPATPEEVKANPVVYANGTADGLKKTNPSKIDVIKAQGQNAKLTINPTGTTDYTGALISGEVSDSQATAYHWNAAPKSTGDKENAPYWSVVRDANGAKAYVSFDTPISSTASSFGTSDFTFCGSQGSNIKPDNIAVDKDHPNTIVFTFNNTNRDYAKALGNASTLEITIENSATIKTVNDGNNENAQFVQTKEDLNPRTVTITGATNTETPVKVVSAEYNDIFGQVTVVVDDVKNVSKVLLNGAEYDYSKNIDGNKINVTTNSEYAKIELVGKDGKTVLAYNKAKQTDDQLTVVSAKYITLASGLNITVNNVDLVDKVIIDGNEIAADRIAKTKETNVVSIVDVTSKPTSVKLIDKAGKEIPVTLN